MMANILINYLQGKSYSKFYDESLEDNKGINLVARYVMSHLIDEAVFDFQSLNTEYARRGFSEASFTTQSSI